MTWFGTNLSGSATFQTPKQKSRFLIESGNGGFLVSAKSVKKPTATVETKQYRMINHFYNYPGLVKWEPITITFVDTKYWGSDTATTDAYTGRDLGDLGAPFKRYTSAALWEMLLASGYTPPSGQTGKSSRATSISSPEKASTVSISFGYRLYIHQLHPTGNKLKPGQDAEGNATMVNTGEIVSEETWEIYNPIITKISWGELDYGDDSLVEYTLDIAYDWAVHHQEYPGSQ